jgi:hypothetical protein
MTRLVEDSARLTATLPVPGRPTFLANMWDYRTRLFPLRMTSLEGLAAIERLGAQPDLIYVDADHSADAVTHDLAACTRLFPGALLVGDDWQWPSVQEAVRCHASTHGLVVHAHAHENWWWLEATPARVPPLANALKRQRTQIDFVSSGGVGKLEREAKRQGPV